MLFSFFIRLTIALQKSRCIHIDFHKYYLVELMGPLSNASSALLSLLRGTIDPTPRLMTTRLSGTSTPVQKQRRLEQATQKELVARYQTGDLMTELAKRYGIHRRTVSAILKRHSVPTRASGLSPEQIQRAEGGDNITPAMEIFRTRTQINPRN